ncbi:hypothetical protein [Kitasatospora azatica]|uniref:hypothetical protein n=1 Tax=Kitasatospora azatica TaxID=58347 RepID=UPI0012F7B742|nr:hypothetical protein [Kitasatospora azatica]
MLTFAARRRDLTWAVALEYATVLWLAAGISLLIPAASASRAPMTAGLGIDAFAGILASSAALRALHAADRDGRRRALGLVLAALAAAAGGVLLPGAAVLDAGLGHAGLGPTRGWAIASAVVMLLLALGKARFGRRLANTALTADGRLAVVHALVALGVVLASTGSLRAWWWVAAALGCVCCLWTGLGTARDLRRT